MSTLHCYQVHKRGEAGNDHKVKAGWFWSKRLYNPFTRQLGLEMQFESSDDNSDTKEDIAPNTNIKEVGNDGNGQVAESDVETFDIPGNDAL